MNNNEQYIKRCIELAKQGEGRVAPNPLVGAVVLDTNGNIVGEGYHQKCGEAHAEVNALNQAGEKARGGTLFVNLEPCSHYGKTPPCADLVIEKGIKKLIVGMVDPSPKVSGQGLEKCKKAGIEVISGILEKECQKLNEIFIKNITTQQPFIAIKSAITMDAKIATKTGSSKWITSAAAREEVQRLRNKYDAILTGSGTIMADNPSLTCRMENGRNPIRIVIDSQLKTSPDLKVYNADGTKVFVAVAEDIEEEKMAKFGSNIEFIKCPLSPLKREEQIKRSNALEISPLTSFGRNDTLGEEELSSRAQSRDLLNKTYINIEYLTQELYQKGITSLLIEAGGKLNGELIRKKLVDKVYLFMAPKILGDMEAKNWIEGYDVEDINKSLNLKFGDIKHFYPDIMLEAYL